MGTKRRTIVEALVGSYLIFALFVLLQHFCIQSFTSSQLVNSHGQDQDSAMYTAEFLSRNLLADGGMPNCTPPGIEQFPHPLMNQETRKNGGITIHILVTLYMFLGLAIVCDEYFVPSLSRICEAMNISPDVAGATFMAAGSSAPELATSVIGVFIAKDDIGLGTVVGSAVYNMAFVVGICGLFAGREIVLNWWPLFRDSFFYLMSILALLFCIYGESVTWVGSVILLAIYAIYIMFMCFNEKIEKCIKKYGTDSCSPAATPFLQRQMSDFEAFAGSEEFEIKDTMFEAPEGCCQRFLWMISLPISLVSYVTIPDCRKKRWQNFYILSFLLSCLWISIFSYILVWMVTIIGFTIGIPDTMMGLTFLAAGVSIPDAIASLLVAKKGEGDMAVSNAVGSNVFDILVCMGVPWFLKTAVISPGSVVTVYSKGLTYSTLSLVSTIVMLLLALFLNKWSLDKKIGVVLMIWYVAVEIFASLYELNIFGYMNPPECPSDY